MSFTETLNRNLKFVIIFPVLLAAVIVGLSLFQQPLYKSSVSLLVVQRQAGEDSNAQESVKSAEQIADTLSRVVDSEVFRTSVLASGQVSVSISDKPWERARDWNKIVKTKNITDTGILVIDVYQPTSAQATKLATAIEGTLTTGAYDYTGVSRDMVSIRQLNPPAPTNDKPATPNLPLNGAVAWLSGLIIAFSLLLLFPNARWFSHGGEGEARIQRTSRPVAPITPTVAPMTASVVDAPKLAVQPVIQAPRPPVQPASSYTQSAQASRPAPARQASGIIYSSKLTEAVTAIQTENWRPQSGHPMAAKVQPGQAPRQEFQGFQVEKPTPAQGTQPGNSSEETRSFVRQANDFVAKKQI